MRCSDGSKKARKAFENALVLDPECMDAVFAMAELDVEEERYNDAIALLQKYLQFSRPEYMHRRLGNVYMVWSGSASSPLSSTCTATAKQNAMASTVPSHMLNDSSRPGVWDSRSVFSYLLHARMGWLSAP